MHGYPRRASFRLSHFGKLPVSERNPKSVRVKFPLTVFDKLEDVRSRWSDVHGSTLTKADVVELMIAIVEGLPPSEQITHIQDYEVIGRRTRGRPKGSEVHQARESIGE